MRNSDFTLHSRLLTLHSRLRTHNRWVQAEYGIDARCTIHDAGRGNTGRGEEHVVELLYPPVPFVRREAAGAACQGTATYSAKDVDSGIGRWSS